MNRSTSQACPRLPAGRSCLGHRVPSGRTSREAKSCYQGMLANPIVVRMVVRMCARLVRDAGFILQKKAG
jgi:hypothetical protein